MLVLQFVSIQGENEDLFSCTKASCFLLCGTRVQRVKDTYESWVAKRVKWANYWFIASQFQAQSSFPCRYWSWPGFSIVRGPNGGTCQKEILEDHWEATAERKEFLPWAISWCCAGSLVTGDWWYHQMTLQTGLFCAFCWVPLLLHQLWSTLCFWCLHPPPTMCSVP